MRPLHEPVPKTAAGILSVLTAVALVSGGAGGQRSDVARADTPDVNVTSSVLDPASIHLMLKLNEFKIGPYVNSVRAGEVKISIFNRGKRVHEMLVVNAKGKLPMKRGRVDEAALKRKHRVIGELSDVRPGRSASKTFSLKKGSYMLFCNLRGHYGAGMRASLIVRGR